MVNLSIRALVTRYRLALTCIGIVGATSVVLSACEAGDPSLGDATIVFDQAPTVVYGGQTVQFQAHLEDEDGDVIDDPDVTFEISEEAESLVDLNAATGQITAATMLFEATQQIEVTATVNDVNVDPVTRTLELRSRVTTFDITQPLSGNLGVGATHQFGTNIQFQTGSPTTPAPMVFWSSNSSAVSVDQTGMITANATTPTGQPARITASAEGFTDFVDVTVVAAGAAVASILVSPSHQSIAITQTLQFTAEAYNASGVVIPGVTFTWSGTNAAATVSPTGLVTATANGGTIVSATASGVTGTGAVSVGAVGSISARVQVAPNVFMEGATVTALSGTTVVGTQVTNRDGRATIPGLTPGTYTVTVSRTGFQTQTFPGIVVAQNSTTPLPSTVTLVP